MGLVTLVAAECYLPRKMLSGAPHAGAPPATSLARILARTLALMLTLVLVACGGSSFDGTVYRGNGIAFRVPPAPPSWQRIDVSHAALAFRDEANDATIAVNGRCGDAAQDTPLTSLTQHLFLQFTEREILKREVIPFDGREAMHSVVVAKLDGVPKKFDVWVMKKDGCVYDLLFIARQSGYDAGVVEFQRFARGFSTLPYNGE